MERVNGVSVGVLDQLTDVAQQQQISLEALLTFYSQERLLVRLAASSYEDQYWLNGDYLVGLVANDFVKTASGMTLCTKTMANHLSIIEHAFKEICTEKIPEDGIQFVSEELDISSDGEEVHIRIPARLEHVTTYIEITINLFKTIPMAPKTMELMTILDGSSTTILAYPTELIIAHKFNTIYRYPALEQAMKEYYDVYLLASTQNFEGRVLQEAIIETFDRHKTTIEKCPAMFSYQYQMDMNKDKTWQQNINQQTVPFNQVQKLVQQLLQPIYEQIIAEDEFFENWDYTLCEWR